MKIINLIGVFFLSSIAVTASADIVSTPSSNPILEIWSWTDTGTTHSGDVVLRMTTGIAECPAGVYVKNSQYAKMVLSVALSAYTTGKPVGAQVWNDSSRIWTGSSTPYCEVRAITLR